MAAAVALALLVAASDPRPTLIAAGAKRPVLIEQEAVRRVQRATRGVMEAARAQEAAKGALRDARKRARATHEELEAVRERQAAAAMSESDQHMSESDRAAATAWRREVYAGRAATLGLLIGFTFMNGVARRSLSSAGPSMVAEQLLTIPRADHIFMLGFEAFAIGKLLVVPTTLLLGVRRALLLQLSVMTTCCAAYLVAAGNPLVQLVSWVAFRIFSAMAVSTMLPFVGAWFPRRFYGRVFALLFTGFQTGYLVVSYYWQHLLFADRLHWTVPFAQCTAGFGLLLVLCAVWLKERPPPPPDERAKGPAEALLSMVTRHSETRPSEGDAAEAETPARVKLGALMHKVGTRWVFWAMLLACAAYAPAVEYSTHVTSYLKEMQSAEGPARGGFVCLQSVLCEGRYRNYVFSYVVSLLLGSVVYDRASQLDRAFLIVGLLLLNALCWLALALAEPDAPAPAWVKSAAADLAMPQGLLRSALRRWVGKAPPDAAASLAAAATPVFTLSGHTKTALASIAGATIALPSSLPFAIFSLDFGKEGAAVLSGLLSVVGSLCAFTFLRAFPGILRKRGWFGVHASLATLAMLAALSMGAIMFSDSRKFARGYVIRSSLMNETVVTLYACSRPACCYHPMWRPGQRRTWGPASGTHIKPHAPNGICHLCGKSDRLLECTVDEAAAAAAVLTPFESCGEWIRQERPLRKPKQGWAFVNDPEQFPLALSELDGI